MMRSEFRWYWVWFYYLVLSRYYTRDFTEIVFKNYKIVILPYEISQTIVFC